MSDVLMTNIFFAITAFSSIIITLLLSIILIIGIKVMKRFKKITELVADETEHIVSDVHGLRKEVKRELGLVKGIATAALIKRVVSQFFTK